MRILAIDPGSRLGWATNQTGRLEWGTENFGIKNGESSGNRWRRFGEWLVEVSLCVKRTDPRFFSPGEPAPPFNCKVDLIVYERAVFMPKARAAAEIAGGFTTRLEEHCERHGIALQPVSVTTLKKFATGKGNAGKDAMIAAAMTKLRRDGGAKAVKEIVEGSFRMVTEHEADALWCFWWAMENCK